MNRDGMFLSNACSWSDGEDSATRTKLSKPAHFLPPIKGIYFLINPTDRFRKRVTSSPRLLKAPLWAVPPLLYINASADQNEKGTVRPGSITNTSQSCKILHSCSPLHIGKLILSTFGSSRPLPDVEKLCIQRRTKICSAVGSRFENSFEGRRGS
jgi:hypothetical protein